MIIIEKVIAPVATNAEDSVQLAILTERGFTADKNHPNNPRLNLLKRRLLELAGWAVILAAIEEDLENLFTRGILIDGRDSRKKRGEPSRCHENVATLYNQKPGKLTIMTGYALSADGIWRQHSWAIRKNDQALLETTEKRVAYYGYALTPEEAEMFCRDNG